MARIIDLGVTKEMLTMDNFPSIKIIDKCYVVDNRQKTFEKIQKIQDDKEIADLDKTDKILEIALGAKALKEIKDLNLPSAKYNYLTYCVMAAITEEDEKELYKRGQEFAKN